MKLVQFEWRDSSVSKLLSSSCNLGLARIAHDIVQVFSILFFLCVAETAV